MRWMRKLWYEWMESVEILAWIAGIIAFFSLSGIIGAFLWPYTINSWLEVAGKEPQVQWWQGFLLGYVPYLGQLAIPAAVITWIAMMAIR